MIQARLIREKTAQLDLEVEESRKVPVSFWLPDNIKTFALQNHRMPRIATSWKKSSIPTFCAGKNIPWGQNIWTAPPPLILGIVQFFSWDDHNPTLDPHRAWWQSSRLFLIAQDHQDHQDHHPTLEHHRIELGRNRANYSWLLVAGTRHWARPSPWDSNHSSCSASSQPHIVLL